MDEELQSNTCILPSTSSSTARSSRLNMKFFILAALLAVAAAGTIPYSSTHPEAKSYGAGHREAVHATLLSESDTRNEDGSSSFSYASSDSINREEKQHQKQTGTGFGTVNQGSTQYVAPDGQQISMSWVADENGFRPTGAHLPTPPPVPAEIAAMLPTLPRLTHEQLYGGAAYAAPAGTAAYAAPQYETPRVVVPKYDVPRYQVPTAPVPAPTMYRKTY